MPLPISKPKILGLRPKAMIQREHIIKNGVSELKRREPGAFPETLSRNTWPKNVLCAVVDHAIRECHKTLEQVKSRRVTRVKSTS
jgi:hypothetical protein